MRSFGLAAIAGLFLAGFAPCSATAITISTSANPADGWRAIAPVGNLEGQPISAVGLAWEASHVGWNTSFTFDDSDAAGWNTPVTRDVTRYGGTSTNNIWAEGQQGSGATPAYFRKLFTLADAPASAYFGGQTGPLDFSNTIDDDAQIYLNGVLVFDDENGLSGPIPLTDVTAYLQPGENLLAVKAHDSFGLDEHFSLTLQIDPVPEAAPTLLVGLALAGLAGLRRRT
jgi:hypothetical protein